MQAIDLIAAERKRQIEQEGWDEHHDDYHIKGELAQASSIYVTPQEFRLYRNKSSIPVGWPWDKRWWKPTPDDRIRELVKAGALIVAEIERLQRKQ